MVEYDGKTTKKNALISPTASTFHRTSWNFRRKNILGNSYMTTEEEMSRRTKPETNNDFCFIQPKPSNDYHSAPNPRIKKYLKKLSLTTEFAPGIYESSVCSSLAPSPRMIICAPSLHRSSVVSSTIEIPNEIPLEIESPKVAVFSPHQTRYFESAKEIVQTEVIVTPKQLQTIDVMETKLGKRSPRIGPWDGAQH
jgi:hypothetical protein